MISFDENEEADEMYPLKIGVVVSEASLWELVQSELRSLPVTVVFEMATVESVPAVLEKIGKFRPEVLLLDPSVLPEPLPKFLHGMRAEGIYSQVVVIRDRADSEDILTALRAGAKEYLYPPFSPSLKHALERISMDIEAQTVRNPPAKGKVLGFLSVKGGCGATTLACHAALEVARQSDKETLLADLDFSAGLVRILMHSKSRYSILDAMNNLQRLDQSYWRGLVSNGYEGVEVIAATPLEMPQRMPQCTELQRVLRFIRSQYEWTIADLGRGLDSMSLTCIGDLDSIVLVTSLEMPALQMAKLTLRYISEAGVPKEKVKLVLNRFSKRHGLTQEDVESVLATEVFCVIPNDYRALEDAYSHDRLLPEGHNVRQAIGRMATRLTGIQNAEQKKKFSLFGF